MFGADVTPPTAGYPVAAAGNLGRSVLLAHPAAGVIVRIDVALPVAQGRRTGIVGVTQVAGHAACRQVTHIGERGPERGGHRVRLGRSGQVDDRVGEVQLSFGEPHELDRPRRRVGKHETVRVGEADVLRGEDHEAPGDEAGILAGVEHAGEPVQRRVRVRAADCLDEGRHDVVVLVIAVTQGAGGQRRLGVVQGDGGASVLGGQAGRDLERGEHVAGVALGPLHEMRPGIVVDPELTTPETPLGLGQGSVRQLRQRAGIDGLEAEEGGAAEQRCGEREERIFSGGTDEDEEALLDVRQERVLLGAVEPVHLVEKQDCPPPVLSEAGASSLDDLTHVLDPGVHRGERLERLLGRSGDEAGDRGLAGARRAPQDDGREPVGLDERAQWLARPEEMFLTDDVVEGTRPHPGRQRRPRRQPVLHRAPEQVLRHHATLSPPRPPCTPTGSGPATCPNARPTRASAGPGPRPGWG